MVASDLQARSRAQIADLGRLLPVDRGAVRIRLVEPLYVLSLRMLPGGAASIARAAAAVGIAALPGPGRFSGTGTLALWRNPTELLLVTPERAAADRVLADLAAAPEALAYAVEQSDGLVTLELRGPALDDVLHRLVDVTAVPREPGQGTRARMADIAVFALRLDADRAWLMADRANDQFLAHWAAYAADALPALT